MAEAKGRKKKKQNLLDDDDDQELANIQLRVNEEYAARHKVKHLLERCPPPPQTSALQDESCVFIAHTVMLPFVKTVLARQVSAAFHPPLVAGVPHGGFL
jgi:hypothetical protein